MKRVVLCFFIDALGWKILQEHPHFLEKLAPHRKSLETIFGYSSGCDPSIITGRLPSSHGMWSSYYYSPKTSPFRRLPWLQWLPHTLTKYARVRHYLSKFVGGLLGYTGYFQLYQIPLSHLHYFDYAEKGFIYAPGGVLHGATLFDELQKRGKTYHVSGLRGDDGYKVGRAAEEMHTLEPDLLYITQGKLDAVMHMEGTKSPLIQETLDHYSEVITKLYESAVERYEEVSLFIFSDHGMHDVSRGFAMEEVIAKLPLQFGKDYAVFYDSTMARFWFLRERAEKLIVEALREGHPGRWVEEEEMKRWGVHFPDGMYGERVWLAESGVLLNPSYMTRRVIPGMHGYHPEDEESKAALLANRPIPESCQTLPHLHDLFLYQLTPSRRR